MQYRTGAEANAGLEDAALASEREEVLERILLLGGGRNHEHRSVERIDMELLLRLLLLLGARGRGPDPGAPDLPDANPRPPPWLDERQVVVVVLVRGRLGRGEGEGAHGDWVLLGERRGGEDLLLLFLPLLLLLLLMGGGGGEVVVTAEEGGVGEDVLLGG